MDSASEFLGKIFHNFVEAPFVLEELLLEQRELVDMELLKEVFMDIASRLVAEQAKGDIEYYNSIDNALDMQETLVEELKEAYYLELMARNMLVYKFDEEESNGQGIIYILKADYMPLLNTILDA